MLDTLLSPPFVPFTSAVALLLGLLTLEVVMLALGGTLMGDADAPDLDMDVPELDLPEIEALELGEIDADALEVGDADPLEAGGDAGGALGWTGLGRTPFLIWLASVLTGFGGAGLALQWTGPWPLWLAVPLAAAAALAFARGFGGVFARAVPKLETSAVTPRNLARRRGRVTQGTMRRGRPAEVRVTDRWGNNHYLRAEPLRDADEIGRGAEVLTVWDRRAGALRVVSLD